MLLLMLSGLLSPFVGALIDNLITLGAVTNSARPLKFPGRSKNQPELPVPEFETGKKHGTNRRCSD